MPVLDSLTYQGVFSEQSFKAGEPERIALVSVTGQVARRRKGDDEEVWIGCFLKSCRDGAPRDESPIDVVAVLDTSGSMQSKVAGGDRPQLSRLELAQQALGALLPRLRREDRFGLATFTTEGRVLQSLAQVVDIDQAELLHKISTLKASGGTTVAAGMSVAMKICEGSAMPPGLRHRRVLFLTDMEDATGSTLDSMIEEQASYGLYTSFVGIGLGFNATLAERVTKHRGANYFSITRAEEMRQVIVEHFDWNYFPIAFDVEVSFQSGSLELVEAFGTPFDLQEETPLSAWHPCIHKFYPPDFRREARELLLCARRHGARLPLAAVQVVLSFLSPSSATVIRVDTAFPSAVEEDGSVQGGLVLLRLRPRIKGGTGSARLLLRYTTGADTAAKEVSSCLELEAPADAEAMTPPEPALARGLALHRYVSACRCYLLAASGKGDNPMPLQEAHDRIQELREELDALSEAEAEAMCPGLRGDVRSFAAKAKENLERRR